MFEELGYGFYIIGGYEEIRSFELSEERKAELRKQFGEMDFSTIRGIWEGCECRIEILDELLGGSGYAITTYSGNNYDEYLFFRGEILWSHTEMTEASEICSWPRVFESLPEGTLVVALQFD